MFFQLCATMIGAGAERFATASNEEAAVANFRLECVVDEHRPDLVFVLPKNPTGQPWFAI